MRSIRSLIAISMALVAFGFSFVLTANSRLGADSEAASAPATHSDGHDGGIVLAQRAPVQAQPAIPPFGNLVAVATASFSSATLARLELQKQMLNANGVTDLSALGTLTISGRVVPQPGFVRAAFVNRTASLPGYGAGYSKIPFSGTFRAGQTPAPQPMPPPKAAPSATILPTAPAYQVGPPKGGHAVFSTDTTQTVVVKPSNMTTAATIVHKARGLKLTAAEAAVAGRGDGTISVAATKIIGSPLVLPAQSAARQGAQTALGTYPISTAYLVGNNITFDPGTQIVIQPNVRYLVIIANSITVGAGVSLTYEDVPPINPPAVPGKPSSVPGTPSTPSSYSDGTTGGQGVSGTQPLQIGTPPDAPKVEVWTLTINSLPPINLKGQYGYKGVQGGPGGDGGRGGDGSDSVQNIYSCKSGPGAGGTGGKGGHGANGGQGGNGGTGGVWSFYAPGPVILAVNTSTTINVDGGERGDGGDPGLGGNGGAGGSRGHVGSLCNSHGRTDGSAGAAGDPGVRGPDGVAGAMLANSTNNVVIDQAAFDQNMNGPRIYSINSQYPLTAIVGSTINILGDHFVSSDTVTVNGVQATITPPIATNYIVATVPSVWGGVAEVKVARCCGGTVSNSGTLYIRPVVVSTTPPSPSTRLKPGDPVVITGTGFTQQMSVLVNHEQIDSVIAASPTTLTFTMKRPASVPINPASAGGEPALLSVADSGGIIESNTLSIVIATCQMIVIGDSVIWGEGLRELDKIHSLVEAYEISKHPSMTVYKTVRAHTGAVTSWNVSISGTVEDGDIPQDYPSVQQQEDDLASQPGAQYVDLVLVTSCANDVGFDSFLDPLASKAIITSKVKYSCHDDMYQFIMSLTNKFPAATIIVAGYYQGLSIYSDPAMYSSIVGVMYGLSNNKGDFPAQLGDIIVGTSPLNKVILADNSAYFASQANMQLQNAVNEVNAANLIAFPSLPTRVFFADPGFGPTNAANTGSTSWVFGLAGIPPILEPTDSYEAKTRRMNLCQSLYNSNVSVDYTFCKLASTGHPNETGAIQYFNAMKSHLP